MTDAAIVGDPGVSYDASDGENLTNVRIVSVKSLPMQNSTGRRELHFRIQALLGTILSTPNCAILPQDPQAH